MGEVGTVTYGHPFRGVPPNGTIGAGISRSRGAGPDYRMSHLKGTLVT
jgi:hypothetical protein